MYRAACPHCRQVCRFRDQPTRSPVLCTHCRRPFVADELLQGGSDDGPRRGRALAAAALMLVAVLALLAWVLLRR